MYFVYTFFLHIQVDFFFRVCATIWQRNHYGKWLFISFAQFSLSLWNTATRNSQALTLARHSDKPFVFYSVNIHVHVSAGTLGFKGSLQICIFDMKSQFTCTWMSTNFDSHLHFHCLVQCFPTPVCHTHTGRCAMEFWNSHTWEKMKCIIYIN